MSESPSDLRRLRITGLHHITLLCADVNRSASFYRDLLGMRLVERSHNPDDPNAEHLLFGSVATILLLVPLLGRLNEAYEHVREHRGLQNYGQAPLEAVLVVSAVIALVLLVAWFFVFTDSSPLPAHGRE